MKNEMPNEIYVDNECMVCWRLEELGEATKKVSTKYIRADSQPTDVAGALDTLFHYHGYTSHHVGEDKQKEVWSALQTIRAALTAQQPINQELLAVLKRVTTELNFAWDKEPEFLMEIGFSHNIIGVCEQAIARAEQKGGE